MNKPILSGMNIEQLTEFTDSIGESKFRAKQLHNWIYLKSAKDFDSMTDLSKKTRETLKESAILTSSKIK